MKRRSHRKSVLFGTHGKLYGTIAIAVAVIVLIVVLVTSLSSSSSPALDSPEIAVIMRRGALLAGVRSDVDGFSKDLNGLEIDLAYALAKEIFPDKGEEGVVLVEMNSTMLDAKISDGSIDIAISLEEKDLNTSRYAYSDAYYTDDVIIAIADDKNFSFDNATIGYITGSSTEKHLDKYTASISVQIEKHEYAAYDIMLSDLIKGKISGAVMTGAYFNMYKQSYAISAYDTPVGSIDYAMVTSMEMTPLIQIANDMLSRMKSNGELDALIQKHIGG